ncbi:MAG: hypothetical protein HY038_11180 [Nitrospirae bacterium]|nr:hypothetical protein [Nitrospirota bacterium]
MDGRWNAIGFSVTGLLIFLPLIGSAASPASSETVVSIYPVTSGISRPSATPLSRVLILGTHNNETLATAVAAAKDVFQRGGITIVEAVPARSSGERQGPHLPDRHDVDATFRAIGKEAGADHVIILDVTETLVFEQGKETKSRYLHDERIAVRGIGVESGTVVLEGTARWSHPVERAGEHIRELTAYAIGRAICPAEKWEEATERNNGRGRCRR